VSTPPTPAAAFLSAAQRDIDTLVQHFAAQGVWDGNAMGRPPVPSTPLYGRSVLAQLWLDVGISFLQRGVPAEPPVADYIIDVHMVVQGHTNRYHSARYLRERSGHAGPLWQPTVAVAQGMLRSCMAAGEGTVAVYRRTTVRYVAGIVAAAGCGDDWIASHAPALVDAEAFSDPTP
jgi:hypothetical protein